MLFHPAFVRKLLLANGATECFYVVVSIAVSGKLRQPCKPFATGITLVRPLSCVSVAVVGELSTTSEGLVALLTLVPFLPCMLLKMSGKVYELSRPILTHGALVLILITVNTHMNLEHVCPTETLGTASHRTKVWFFSCVHPDMPL